MSTTGSTINIVSTDIAALSDLLSLGSIYILFEDGTNQYMRVDSADEIGGIGIVSGTLGAAPNGTYSVPVNHDSGTVVSTRYIASGTYYTIGPVSLVTPLTPRIPAYEPPANLFLDSTEHWTTPVGGANLTGRKWTWGQQAATTTPSWGGAGIEVQNGFTIYVTLPQQVSTMTVGVRYETQAYSNSIIEMYGSSAVKLNHAGAGLLYVSFGVQVGPNFPAFTMSTNTEYYIELQAALSGAVKLTYRVRIWDAAGALLLSYTNTLTDTTATNNKLAMFGIAGPGGGSHAVAADIFCTTSNRLGSSTIEYLKAAGVGDLTQGSVATGPGPQWDNNSDGAIPDDDATTTEYSTQNTRDLYTLDPLVDPMDGREPVAFQFIALQQHPGTTTATGMIAMKSVGLEVDNSVVYSCYAQYNYGRWPGLKNPSTGETFTWAQVNALQTGPMRNN